MGVGEANSLGGEAVHLGRRDLRLPAVARRIAVPHIVREDEHDVRRFPVSDRRLCQGSTAGKGTSCGAPCNPEEVTARVHTVLLLKEHRSANYGTIGAMNQGCVRDACEPGAAGIRWRIRPVIDQPAGTTESWPRAVGALGEQPPPGIVIPANAGIHFLECAASQDSWIPACAGMTESLLGFFLSSGIGVRPCGYSGATCHRIPAAPWWRVCPDFLAADVA